MVIDFSIYISFAFSYVCSLVLDCFSGGTWKPWIDHLHFENAGESEMNFNTSNNEANNINADIIHVVEQI